MLHWITSSGPDRPLGSGAAVGVASCGRGGVYTHSVSQPARASFCSAKRAFEISIGRLNLFGPAGNYPVGILGILTQKFFALAAQGTSFMFGCIVGLRLRLRFLAPAIAAGLPVFETGEVRDVSALLSVRTKL
jgi:hypothetical protein